MDIDTLTKESLLPKSQQKSRLELDDNAAANVTNARETRFRKISSGSDLAQ